MQRNQELPIETEQGGRLPMLAVLWDELAGIHNCASFRREFQPELEHLNRFRTDYPGVPPRVLIGMLEATVIDAFREKFPRDGIQALRARLNRSNQDLHSIAASCLSGPGATADRRGGN